MEIALASGMLAFVVWAMIGMTRVSLLHSALGCLIVGYVFGHYFWNASIGPIPLTLDRLAMVGLTGALVIQWRNGKLKRKAMLGADCLLILLLGIFAVSTAIGLSTAPESTATEGLWRLVASYCIPAVLYLVAKQAPLDARTWKMFLIGMTGLGVYLTLTAFAEVAGAWAIVFPRYLSNPELGIHFGRARGPILMSASLGVFLTACLWCTWMLIPQVRRTNQLILITLLPLTALAIGLTFTRSTWIGLVLSGFVVLALHLPKTWRAPVLSTALIGSLLVGIVGWHHMVNLKREGSGAESKHSIQQRTAFAFVSWNMFKDNPMTGVGFGRFVDRKLPYLAERTTSFELESIRGLHHHNTVLSVLTETGMIGLAAFLALLFSWGHAAWKLARNSNAPSWMRSQGVLMLAILVTYLSSAVFHDLSLSPTEHCLLFLLAGLTVGMRATLLSNSQPAVAHTSNSPYHYGGTIHANS